MTQQPSVFGGALVRAGRNQWVWSDGAAAPEVTDLSASQQYNFRCRQFRGATHVEVMLSAAHRDKDMLGWVLDGVGAGRYAQELSGDHVGPYMLTDEGIERMHVEPGEDPLLGHEPIVRKRAIPRVALVPAAEWDAWAVDHPYGATWLSEHEQAIFAKARSLGWDG